MKIGVCIKCVPATDEIIRINQSGKDIDNANLKYIINPYDEFAIEEALKIRDKHSGTEVIIICVGNEDNKEHIRLALAMGCDRGVLIKPETSTSILKDSYLIATQISKVVKKEGITLLITGKIAIDHNNGHVSSMLAAILDWSQAINVNQIEIKEDKLVVVKEIDNAEKIKIELALPTVLGISKGLNQPRYPTIINLMKAKSKLIEEYQIDSIDLKQVEIEKFTYQKQKRECIFIDNKDIEKTCEELVTCLKLKEKII